MSDAADLNASSDTNISISQSTKEESCSREDPEASTDPKTGTSQPTTEGQSCDDINPDVSDTTSISQSTAKHESCNNEDAEASTDATTALSKPTTENESSNDADPKAPADTSEPETPPTFDDQTVRRAFVQKVLGIQILMLLFAVGMVCLFMFSDVIREGLRRNVWVFISSFIIFIAVIIISRAIVQFYGRSHWWNHVGLVLVSLSLSFMLGTTVSYISTISLTALGDTILICLAIIAFNAQSRVDFNFCFGFILSVAVPLITLGIIYGIFSHLLFMQYVALGGLGAFLLSMFFVVDIQKITVWKKLSVKPEEYVSAALFLYVDTLWVLILLLALPCHNL